MYKKLSGMTGTALTEQEEFKEIYYLDVVEVPTNKPMIRQDHEDAVYRTVNGKYKAVIEQIKACHEKGQPVLVGTVSIDKSEELSRRLMSAGIKHTVLNAKFHQKEAEIVAQAGKLGAVTISTNMAGRGTDIMLGGNPEFLAKQAMRAKEIPEEIIAESNGTSDTDNEEIIAARKMYSELYEKFKEEIAPEAEKVREAGGLFILGTERHESRRIDNQLRGRSGRQGDPGESRFYLSLEDDLMRLFGGEDRMNRLSMLIERVGLDENTAIDARMLSNSIESAQKRIEENNFKRRKYVLAYDDVMNQQRTVIYKQRADVLEGGDDIENTIKKMTVSTICDGIATFTSDESPENWSFDAMKTHMSYICEENDFNYTENELKKLKRSDIEDMLIERVNTKFAEKEELFGKDTFLEIQRSILLKNVDTAWMEHIDAMDDLKGMINLQSYAQRDPVTEYRITGGDMFDAMIGDIRDKTVRMILSVVPRPAQQIQRVQVANPLTAGFEGGTQKTVKKVSVRKDPAQKVGRNDPCPCGSGKKYKSCCGANGSSAN